MLKQAQLNHLSTEDFSQEFISHLSDDAIKIFNVKFNSLSQYLGQRHLANLDKSQSNIINRLSPHQLQHVKSDVIQSIFANQVETLLAADLNRLTSERLLLKIPEWRIQELKPAAKERLKKLWRIRSLRSMCRIITKTFS
ncbi:MAG: hypothetical protein HWD61_06320 [Parachlamydiaceae bacterium]|nr:MAG: hypothetical protein HWD61_06320 [Parachlamydiaceae bacterium]